MQVIRTERKKGNFFHSFFKHLFKNHLFESAATLSYYFLFSVFPLVIFVSTAFSTLHISAEKLSYLTRIIPEQLLSVLLGFLSEISLGNTPTLMAVSFLLALYSLGKALQTMKRKFRLAYEIQPKVSWIREWIVTFVFVFLILLSFYASLILIVAGNYIFNHLIPIFPFLEEVRDVIRVLRYTVVTAYLAFVLFGLYYVLPGFKQKKRFVLPGATFALAAWILMSWLFSFYFTHFANYTSLYGSLGTVIALMSWLFLVNSILLLGVHINSYIYNKSTEQNYD